VRGGWREERREFNPYHWSRDKTVALWPNAEKKKDCLFSRERKKKSTDQLPVALGP